MLNVTRAVYSTGNKVRTAPLYQWDYGQILQFEGLDLPANFEAHFSNTPMTGTAITVIGNDNCADIPDSLLQSGGDIWCWVYLHDEVTDGETEYVAVIPVTARPRRDGTEPTPEEQDAIAVAIEALNDATEVLDDAIAHTETYRDQAEAYAIQSESWAIGGTSTRQGEDTDNSKYYRDQAEATARRVTEAVDDFVDTTVPQAIQSVGDEGTAQIALVDAEGTAQIGAVGSAGTAQIALVGAEGTRQVGIVSGEGATQKGNVSAEGSAQIGNVRAEGNTQIGLVQSEGASQIANVSSAGSTQVGNVNSAGATQVGNVNSAGTTQVGLVQAEGTAQIGAVGNAGTAQIGLVEAKGTEQIGLVQAEGASQIAAIEAKGEEVLSEMIDKAPIITETASGAIASFPDGTDAPIKQLTVNIQPQQDLHGYDNPWPAGGGKNLLPTSVAGIKSANAAGTWSGNEYTFNGVKYTINTDQDGNVTGINANGTASADSDIYLVQGYTFPAGSYTLNGCPSGGSSSTYRIFATNWGGDTGSGSTATLNGSTSTNIRVQIKSGTTANNLLFKPMVRLASVTDGTFAPYSNICPITGWTGTNVTRTGKNLLGGLALGQAIVNSVNDATKSWLDENTDGKYVAITASTAVDGKAFFNTFKPNTQYTLILRITRYQAGSKNSNILFRYTDGTYKMINFTATSDTEVVTIAVTSDASKTLKQVETVYGGGTARLFYEQSGIFEGVLTATDFAPYTGTTYPITWQSEAGTVYGGTLTVNQDGSADVVADHTVYDFTAEMITSVNIESSGRIKRIYLDQAVYDGTITYRNGLCDKYTVVTSFTDVANTPGSIALNISNANQILIHDDNIQTVDDAKAAMPVRVYYPLATPVTYTLTAAEMTTLLGQNNWWSDTGNIENLEYRCDTRKFIEKKLAALVAALS